MSRDVKLTIKTLAAMTVVPAEVAEKHEGRKTKYVTTNVS